MPRNKGFTRKRKGGRHTKNQPPPAGELKAPPDPNSTSKQPNPSINLDLGSNVVPRFNEENNEECANRNKEGKATTIRKLPSSTQKSLINATPPNNFTTVERAIMNPSTSPGNISKPARRALKFSATPMLEINTSGSCASSISSLTASPSSKVMALNRLIDDESNRSAGEETEALHILCKLKSLEEEREKLLSIASENKELWSLSMNTKNLLDGYTSANSLPSHEAVSMESNKSNVPITEVKENVRREL